MDFDDLKTRHVVKNDIEKSFKFFKPLLLEFFVAVMVDGCRTMGSACCGTCIVYIVCMHNLAPVVPCPCVYCWCHARFPSDDRVDREQ